MYDIPAAASGNAGLEGFSVAVGERRAGRVAAVNRLPEVSSSSSTVATRIASFRPRAIGSGEGRRLTVREKVGDVLSFLLGISPQTRRRG